MQGLFLRRMFSEPAPAEVTISVTGTGNSTHCYLTMPDGTKVTAAGSYKVTVGETIVCSIQASVFGESGVWLNGGKVVEATGAYNYVVTKPASIALEYSKSASTIHITEE